MRRSRSTGSRPAKTESPLKQESLSPPVQTYAKRLRREVIDIAGKVVRTAGRTILKVTEATAGRLNIEEIFRQVADPPRFRWT